MKFQTPLCELAYKYGSDKCPQIKHPFTPFYYSLLKSKRRSFKKVLEIGIGYLEVMPHVKKITGFYKNGASLYMWRDFFPQAQIIGADIFSRLMFSDRQIVTFICDQTKIEDLENLIKQNGPDIDLIIDDGSHEWTDQVFTCQNLMKLVKKDVIYIIEDVREANKITEVLSGEYKCLVPNLEEKYRDDKVVVVTKNHVRNFSL
jgi:hypothetical protein